MMIQQARPRRSQTALLSALAWLLAASVITRAPAASAQSSSAQARSLFREARRLMDKKNYAPACPKFEESLRLDPGMGTQFNLAHCWEMIGRTASAWGLFLDVAAAAEASGQRKRERAARERAAALEAQLSRLQIDVPHPAPGMTVLRAGEEVGPAAWGTAIALDPGTHSIEVNAPGKRPWSGEVVVDQPGVTVPLEIPSLEDIEPAVAVEEPEPERPPAPAARVEADTGGGGRLAAMLALTGVAVGGIATGAVYGLAWKDATAAARQLCTGGAGGNECVRDAALPAYDGGGAEERELLAHRDDAKRSAVITYVAFGVGAAAAVASGVLLLTGSSSERDVSSDGVEATVAPSLAPELTGIVVNGRF
jgi:hypothetical protein